MIDLKELERRLDEALAKETSESLSRWLHNKRKDDLENRQIEELWAEFYEELKNK